MEFLINHIVGGTILGMVGTVIILSLMLAIDTLIYMRVYYTWYGRLPTWKELKFWD